MSTYIVNLLIRYFNVSFHYGLQGDETGMNLTHDFLRTIVLMDRMGLGSIEDCELLEVSVEIE